jgi:hypothetical protein
MTIMRIVRRYFPVVRLLPLLLVIATLVLGVFWYRDPRGNYEPLIYVLATLAALIGAPTLWERTGKQANAKGSKSRRKKAQSPNQTHSARASSTGSAGKSMSDPSLGRRSLAETIAALEMSRHHIWRGTSGLTQTVKVGWSWPAFLFGFYWALIKRMTWIGLSVPLLAISIMATLTAAGADDDTLQVAVLGLTLIISLIFGANGNSWREQHLRAQGYRLVGSTLKLQPILGYSIVGIRGLQSNKRWRHRVVVWAGVIVVVTVGITYLPSRWDWAFWSSVGQFLAAGHCDRVVLSGHLNQPSAETSVWFEWGDTPELGMATPKQHFSEESDFYAHLVGLNERTTYYYRAAFENPYGLRHGRVLTFQTCNE